MHGSATQNSGISTTNRDWWPNQLNVNILHQNDKRSNPMATDFDPILWLRILIIEKNLRNWITLL